MKNPLNRFTLLAFALAVLTSTLPLRAEMEEAPVKSGRDARVEIKSEALPKKVSFKAKDLYKHAEFLAGGECEGRLAGSPGQAIAREYIIAKLKQAGYEDVKRLPFEFISGVKLGQKNYLSARFSPDAVKNKELNWYRKPERFVSQAASTQEMGPPAESNLADYKVDEDYRPFRISKSSSDVIDAPLIFAGYGISAPEKGYDDYKDLDVKGKVVLVIRHEPETPELRRIGVEKADPHAGWSAYSDFFYKAAMARDKGAAALVIVNGKRGMSNAERAALESFQRGGGRTDCGIPLIQVFPEIADDWLRPSGKDIATLQQAIDAKLTPQSFAVEGVRIALRADVVRERATDENLAVVLPGADPVLKNEIVVIGAHYDHLGRGNEFSLADAKDMGQIHCGADDNASGVASVLELAKALKKNGAALKRTVWIMFFGAEELGTLGSIAFTKGPPDGFEMKNVSTMLNLDMVGRCRDEKVMVYGTGTGVGLERLLKRANEKIGLDLKPTADGFGGSDQTAFVNAGVPVLFFFTGSHEDYHKPSDTADKLNVNGQARITALVYEAAVESINGPERPKFVKIDAPRMSTGMGGVGLGTLPDYAYEGKGLRLSGVRGGSAADKAGLKAGDVIVKLAERKIENIYDYMNALKQCTPDVEITATVQRDGRDLDVKVTPEKR